MARPGRRERNRAARSFHQLRRFHHVINSDKVFGTHSPPDPPCPRQAQARQPKAAPGGIATDKIISRKLRAQPPAADAQSVAHLIVSPFVLAARPPMQPCNGGAIESGHRNRPSVLLMPLLRAIGVDTASL